MLGDLQMMNEALEILTILVPTALLGVAAVVAVVFQEWRRLP